MAIELKFDVDHPGEQQAGLNSYTDTVTVQIASGDPGGDEGEFEEYMRDCLAEWFDGAKVTPNVEVRGAGTASARLEGSASPTSSGD